MTKSEISAAIQLWKKYVSTKNNTELINLFVSAGGNSFIYEVQTYPLPTDKLHMYPGVVVDKATKAKKLCFFVIPKEYDNAGTVDIQNYIKVCPVGNFLQGGQIPDPVAQERINRWANNYPTWIPWQNNKIDRVFLAFQVDRSDFEADSCNVTLGLTLDPDPDRADLIVTNYMTQAVVYDDYSIPVPPYGPSATSASFYLLNMQ